MQKRAIITGGAGFIGSHLVEKLLTDNWNIVIIDNFNDFYAPIEKRGNIKSALKNKNCTLEEGDITNTGFISAVFKKHQPTHVVHLAARAGVRPSLINPKLYRKVNVEGTKNILEAAKSLRLTNFIFGSSSSVYGNNKKIPFAESDRVEDQISPYATSKREAEKLCEKYARKYDSPTTVLRFFTVYGARQRPDLAIRKFMTRILAREPIEMYGDGSTSRDYTYIDDIIEGVVKSIKRPFNFEVINLGNSKPVRLIQLIHLIEEVLGIRAQIITKPMQKGDVDRTYADVSKAKKLLSWQSTTDIETGLEKMAQWIKNY